MTQTEQHTSFGSLVKMVAANDTKYEKTIFSMLSDYAREMLARIGIFSDSRSKIMDIISQPFTASAEQAYTTNKITNGILNRTPVSDDSIHPDTIKQAA